MVFFARKARKEKKSTQAPLTSTKGEKTLLASSLLRIPPRVHVLAMPQFFPPLPFAPGLHLSQSKLLVLPFFFFFLEKEVEEG